MNEKERYIIEEKRGTTWDPVGKEFTNSREAHKEFIALNEHPSTNNQHRRLVMIYEVRALRAEYIP